MGVYRELELEVGVARGLANKLRAKHLEEYNLQGNLVTFADSSGIELKAGRLKLDAKLSASLEARRSGQEVASPRKGPGLEEGPGKPSAPPPSPPDRETSGGHGKTMSGASIMASPQRC